MQDVAMILGLPLEGIAVTGIIQNDGWRDMVRTLKRLCNIKISAPMQKYIFKLWRSNMHGRYNWRQDSCQDALEEIF